MDQRPHIIVVEDEATQRRVLVDYLTKQNFRVSGVDGGPALRKLVERDLPHVVLLDVGLPGEDGFALARWLRERNARIGIIMVTAASETVDRVLGLEIGADDYIAKPFEPRELLARLRAILRRRRAGPEPDVLRYGRLEIDRGAREVRLDGAPRPLTGYQFALLLALAEHAGRVMSRDALMDHIKGEQIEAFDRSIDVHVSRIRAAIEHDPKKPRRVITVRGMGYLFAKAQE
jgi:DNA-binding response OmpR family regulator